MVDAIELSLENQAQDDRAQQKEAIAIEIMQRLSRGNVSLQIGRVVTEAELAVRRERVLRLARSDVEL